MAQFHEDYPAAREERNRERAMRRANNLHVLRVLPGSPSATAATSNCPQRTAGEASCCACGRSTIEAVHFVEADRALREIEIRRGDQAR